MNDYSEGGTLDLDSINNPLGLGFGRTLGYMRFMGKTLQVYGFICCLTLVGAAVGVPLIMVARRFLKGLDYFQKYHSATDTPALKAGFDELGRSFRLMKILTFVSLGVGVLYLIVVFIAGSFALMSPLGVR